MTEAFEELVAKDVRHECTEQEVYVLESNIREWLTVLNSLKRDVEVQLSAQKVRVNTKQAELLDAHAPKSEWLKYKAHEDSWRVSAVRFMVSVEERMLHVKNLRAAKGNQKVMTA